MKRTLLMATICLVLVGCSQGTYNETTIAKLGSPPKTIALGEFKGNDAGIAQLFADTVAVQLSTNGFKVTTDQNRADVIVTGAVCYKGPGFYAGLSDWILSGKTRDGSTLYSLEFHQVLGGWRTDKIPKEIMPELSRRLVRSLRDAND